MQHVLFFPLRSGAGRANLGTVTHRAPLAVFLTSPDNTTMRGNLATFKEEIRQNLPGTRPLQDSKDLSPGEAGARQSLLPGPLSQAGPRSTQDAEMRPGSPAVGLGAVIRAGGHHPGLALPAAVWGLCPL